MVLLQLVVESDESSRFYQRLVKEKAMSVDWTGGIDFEFGGAWDYNGPMLVTSRTGYKPGHTAADGPREVNAAGKNGHEHGGPKKGAGPPRRPTPPALQAPMERTFGPPH